MIDGDGIVGQRLVVVDGVELEIVVKISVAIDPGDAHFSMSLKHMINPRYEVGVM